MAYAALHYIYELCRDVETSRFHNDLPELNMKSVLKILYPLDTLVLKQIKILKGSRLRVDPLEDQIQDAIEKYMHQIETHISSASSLSESDTESTERVNDSAILRSKELRETQQEISSLTEKLKNKLDLLHYNSEEEDDDDDDDDDDDEDDEEEEEQDEQPGPLFAADDLVSSRIYGPGGQDSNKLLVGLDDELRQLVDRIVEDDSHDPRMISIEGMAGIGKTTLAQQVYNHPSIISHFDTRIMVTIGPNSSFRKFLLFVLHQIGNDSIETFETLKNRQLEAHLKKVLKGRKCLLVLDDLWDDNGLVSLYFLLRANTSRTQIIFTTRLHYLTAYVHISAFKRFLNDEDSWDLLRGMVFTSPEERCSYQLEKFGRQIAKNCEGLPLAIISVAKLLCQNEKTVEYWKKVSEDENPLNIGIDDDSQISKSLYLSYTMLPEDLKGCFLYVGVFPKSYRISSFNLIRLWITEGFISPRENGQITIEEVAKGTLSQLVSNNVVLEHKQSSLGEIKTCRVHTVFRSLCIGVAQKEEFCHVIKKFPQGSKCQPRVCIHNNAILSIKKLCNTLKSTSLRTLLCFGPKHVYPLHVDFDFTLLRILHALRIRFYTFPYQVLELLCLKYLTLTYDGEFPKSIFKLWKLHVLIVGQHWNIKSLHAPQYFPIEIWDLKWLKHLQCMGSELPDPCTNGQACDDYPMLKYLIKLSGIGSRSCTQRVLARMPNLEKLGIRIELTPDEVEDFSFFQTIDEQLYELRSFKCVVFGLKSQIICMNPPVFPSNICKLTLSGCRFPWEYITAIGSLRSLQVLKLRCRAFHGSMWEPREGEFCRLEYLLLEDLDIMEWRAQHNHFPCLHHLIVKHCYKLREIPVDIGNIEKLEKIEVEGCSPSLNPAVEQIKAKANIHARRWTLFFNIR